MYLKTNDVIRIYRLSRSTLIRLEEQGQLTVSKTPGGHRRYLKEEIDKLFKRGQ